MSQMSRARGHEAARRRTNYRARRSAIHPTLPTLAGISGDLQAKSRLAALAGAAPMLQD
jgi:hypothetical protein